MANKQYDVLIPGCGPTGATLANLLRARGRSVAIFDREPEVYPTPRAMVLDPESCRIYTSMGILQRLIPEDASPYARNEFVDGRQYSNLPDDGYAVGDPTILTGDLQAGGQVWLRRAD